MDIFSNSLYDIFCSLAGLQEPSRRKEKLFVRRSLSAGRFGADFFVSRPKHRIFKRTFATRTIRGTRRGQPGKGFAGLDRQIITNTPHHYWICLLYTSELPTN